MLNKDDAALKEEYDILKSNVHKLQVGEKYKYPELVTTLGLKIKKGKGRETQVKRIMEYIKWDTKERIYHGEIKDAKAKTKKTNNSKYYNLIKDCFLLNLYDYIKSICQGNEINLSHSRALWMSGIVSDGYLLTRTEQERKNAAKIIDVEAYKIFAFREKLKNECMKMVDSTLKQMKKLNIIVYHEVVTLVTSKRDNEGKIIKVSTKYGEEINESEYRIATAEEEKILMECKSIVLDEMLPHVEVNKRMYHLILSNTYYEYMKRVVAKFNKENNTDIDYFYDSYNIKLNESDTSYNTEKYLEKRTLEILQKQIELKNMIKDKMITSKDKVYLNRMCGDTFDEEVFLNDVNAIVPIMIENDEEFNEKMIKMNMAIRRKKNAA